MKNVTISFKNTEKDAIINAWILSHSNYSALIKDLLWETINKDMQKKNEFMNDIK